MQCGKKVLARSSRRRGRAAGPNVNVERGLESDHQFRIALVAPLHPGLRRAAPRRAASTTCRTAVITRSGSVLGMSCPLLVAMTCWAPGASAAKASWSSRHTFSCAADRASPMIHRLASRIFADDPPKLTMCRLRYVGQATSANAPTQFRAVSLPAEPREFVLKRVRTLPRLDRRCGIMQKSSIIRLAMPRR
jgi:hypothetical protein